MRTVGRAGCVLFLLTLVVSLGAGTGCNVPDDIAKQVASNAANSAVNYFFRLLPTDLNKLTGG